MTIYAVDQRLYTIYTIMYKTRVSNHRRLLFRWQVNKYTCTLYLIKQLTQLGNLPDPYMHWPPVYPRQTSWWRPPQRIQYIHTPVGWTPSWERLCSPSGEKSFNIHKSDGASLLLVEFIFAPTKNHLILTKVEEKFNTIHCHSNTVWKIFTYSRKDHKKVSKISVDCLCL